MIIPMTADSIMRIPVLVSIVHQPVGCILAKGDIIVSQQDDISPLCECADHPLVPCQAQPAIKLKWITVMDKSRCKRLDCGNHSGCPRVQEHMPSEVVPGTDGGFHQPFKLCGQRIGCNNHINSHCGR